MALLDDIEQTEPTAEEIAQARENALAAGRPASWVWDESVVSYVAPIPIPTDGYPYLWDETVGNWTAFPGFPRN